MSDQTRLSASIEVAGVFKVGSNANQFQLTVRNDGEAVVRRAGGGANLYLRGQLGAGAEALFLNVADARLCEKDCTPAGWRADWDFSGRDEGRFGLRIYTFDSVLFERGQVLTITFTKVIARTAPGTAVLSFETDFSDAAQRLILEKRSDAPGIISLYSIPPEGVQNLPGADVELRWRVDRLNNLELFQTGTTDPLPCDFSGEEGARTIAGVQTDMEFRLRGYDGARPVERQLPVRVLRTGWYDLTHRLLEGDPGYPVPGSTREVPDDKKGIALEATLLLSTGREGSTSAGPAGDDVLYGLFRHDLGGVAQALLFATSNPFGGWRLIASHVPGEDGLVPAGFDSSPGAYCRDRIWLIGGSQIDPDASSNGVWSIDPIAGGAWENCGPAPWRARMGHAIVVMDERIWLMGGRDEAGNALNDVWVLDPRDGRNAWRQQPLPPWSPRCLFGPTVFDGRIWLYGGVKEPFSDVIYDDLHVCSAGEWQKLDITGIIAGGGDARRPIASCLQAFNGALHLFGTFRTIRTSDRSEIVEQLAFRLSTPSTRTWTAFPSDGLQNWGADTSFSYQAVNWGNRMLIARALVYATPVRVAKVYIPPARALASAPRSPGDHS